MQLGREKFIKELEREEKKTRRVSG
jgi:hypothetical protein